MSDLLLDVITSGNPPFMYAGTDCFGNLYVKRGRAVLKSFGYLTMKAVHIQMLYSLDSSSFINCFQRFIARRGMPQIMRSDNGTHFTSAQKELKTALAKVSDDVIIKDFMLHKDIKWIFNTPAASHPGGVW